MNFNWISILFLGIIGGVFHMSTCLAQQSKSDLEKMNLKGKVKSIEYQSYTINLKKKRKIKEWSNSFFNEVGNKTLEWNGDVENPEMINRHEFYYDSLGNLLAIKHMDTDSDMVSLHSFSYDSTSRKEVELVFDKDSIIILKYVYQFNDKGLKVAIDGYDMKKTTNNLIANYSFKYDSFGNKTEEVTTLVSLVTMYSYRYEYGDSTQIITKHITLTQGENFESSRTVQYLYDDRGNLVEEQWAYGDEPFQDKSTYNFDKKFNWIKRIDVVNGKESYFAERKIAYY